MNTIPISELFTITYGHSLDLTFLEECTEDSSDSINYVSRTRENNGVSAIVKKVSSIIPFEAGLITVAGSGNSVLEASVQLQSFYTGYHVFILTPKIEMGIVEKLFYCHCIKQNRYRYNFGRQANKTLKSIRVPKEIPHNFTSIDMGNMLTLPQNGLLQDIVLNDISKWKYFELRKLFDVSASSDELIEYLTLGTSTPYIASTDSNNGVTYFVEEPPTNKMNTITANRGGSVGYFFYQPVDYLATPVDVRILTPKFSMNIYVGLFLITILQLEKFRFNYSRKMGTHRLNQIWLKLPSKNEVPDFQHMENYIKSLPYSSSL